MINTFRMFVYYRPTGLPWLYYLSEKPNEILNDTVITTQFKFPNTVLDLSASAFSLDGSFLGFKPVRGGLLQFCKNSKDFMNAAFVFGTVYKQSVSWLHSTPAECLNL